MGEAATCFERQHFEHRPFLCRNLADAELLYDSSELIRTLLPSVPKSQAHAVYRVPAGETSIYVPALTLIQALFMGTSILDHYLIKPNAPELLGRATRALDGIQLSLCAPLYAMLATGRLVRLLAWLLLEPEGRRAHASVLHHLRGGRIALELPKLSMGGWARGMVVNEEHLFVYELAQVDIRYPGLEGNIKVRVGRSELSVPAYDPPPESPWSKGYGTRPTVRDPLAAAITVPHEKAAGFPEPF
jgi:hypothetical protein